ncbi:hypothetical protein J3R30DRAFT_3460925 [Lentinula aciculospora]|uniref:Uncharacterized protein n=1 Tax=Lentinula aciculospora TaxID=153920 RepID=A0A9W9DSR0_9AGAR|nr:hypothetical protein J3R30DRAFT_3460925 [Lentinula aciculospora]
MFKPAALAAFAALSFGFSRNSSVPFALSWNSTSPYGQFSGIFSMVNGTYGSAMNITSGTPLSSNLTASYNSTSGKLSLVCAGGEYPSGLVAALVYEPELTPPTYTLQWVNDSDATLPAGSNKTSLVPQDGALISTLGTGIFKEVKVDDIVSGQNVSAFAWVQETAGENEDAQFHIVITDGSNDTCHS